MLMAAWCGIFLADLFLRRRGYEEAKLFDPSAVGGYRSVRWDSLTIMIACTLIGWGLVTNSYSSALDWQGYLLGPLGLGGREGTWAYAGLGVLVALVLGALAYTVAGRSVVRAQER